MIILCENGQQPEKYPIEPNLLEAIQGIAKREAKEEALKILRDGSTTNMKFPELPMSEFLPGLNSVAKHAKLLYKLKQTKRESPKKITNEIDNLIKSITSLAGNLRTISDSSKLAIEKALLNSIDDFDDDSILKRWKRCNAGEAFSVVEYMHLPGMEPFAINPKSSTSSLAIRLESMITILTDIQLQVKAEIAEKPGAQTIFKHIPSDLDLFVNCAYVLRIHNIESMDNLRDIASAIHGWVTGEPPDTTWGERKENKISRKMPRPTWNDYGELLREFNSKH